VVFLKNLNTGSLWHVLGTDGDVPGGPAVWVQKVDQPRTPLRWSVASMMSGYHRYVACDENGQEQEKSDAGS